MAEMTSNSPPPPIGWPQLKQLILELRNANEAGQPLTVLWESFVSAARASEVRPPAHLGLILAVLREVQQGRQRDEIVILDHGCGGGLTLLYLFAIGFRGIYGVDPNSPCEDWNRLLAAECGIVEPRFWRYDGLTVPLDNDSVDVIFSQQVLEHVQPQLLKPYYGEEARVLKPRGLAYHQVPHRLVPYDSHSRTWLIHYLPRLLRRPFYRLSGNDPRYIESILWLRWPWCHRKEITLAIGNCEDRTVERLVGVTNLDDYEKENRGLRRFIGMLVRLPLLGRMAGWLLRNFVMLDTVSVKSASTP